LVGARWKVTWLGFPVRSKAGYCPYTVQVLDVTATSMCLVICGLMIRVSYQSRKLLGQMLIGDKNLTFLYCTSL
jgi:hypothetical protein